MIIVGNTTTFLSEKRSLEHQIFRIQNLSSNTYFWKQIFKTHNQLSSQLFENDNSTKWNLSTCWCYFICISSTIKHHADPIKCLFVMEMEEIIVDLSIALVTFIYIILFQYIIRGTAWKYSTSFRICALHYFDNSNFNKWLKKFISH